MSVLENGNQNFIFEGNVYSKLFLAFCQVQPYIAPYYFYLHKRAKIKYNFQGIIGEQGTGKSYYAILEALALDPTFDAKRIIFSTMNFLDALDEFEDRALVGRNLIWDDAGVGLPSSEWYALSNKVVQLVMQTVRTLHPTIKFTMPDISYIDPKTRKILTTIIDCARHKENRTDLSIYTQKRIRIMDETIHSKFSFRIGMIRIKYGDVRLTHIKPEHFPEIFKDYEKIQEKFKFMTRKKLTKLLQGMKENKLATEAINDYTTITLSDLEKRLVYETYERIFGKAREYINKARRIDIDKVMIQFKVSRQIALAVKRYYDRKLLPDQVKEDLEVEG